MSSVHTTVVDALPDIPGIPSSASHASQSIPKIHETYSTFYAYIYESTNTSMHVSCTYATLEILTLITEFNEAVTTVVFKIMLLSHLQILHSFICTISKR
jgi:hypothetical protein